MIDAVIAASAASLQDHLLYLCDLLGLMNKKMRLRRLQFCICRSGRRKSLEMLFYSAAHANSGGWSIFLIFDAFFCGNSSPDTSLMHLPLGYPFPPKMIWSKIAFSGAPTRQNDHFREDSSCFRAPQGRKNRGLTPQVVARSAFCLGFSCLAK